MPAALEHHRDHILQHQHRRRVPDRRKELLMPVGSHHMDWLEGSRHHSLDMWGLLQQVGSLGSRRMLAVLVGTVVRHRMEMGLHSHLGQHQVPGHGVHLGLQQN